MIPYLQPVFFGEIKIKRKYDKSAINEKKSLLESQFHCLGPASEALCLQSPNITSFFSQRQNDREKGIRWIIPHNATINLNGELLTMYDQSFNVPDK